jgi:hypothetical protein
MEILESVWVLLIEIFILMLSIWFIYSYNRTCLSGYAFDVI